MAEALSKFINDLRSSPAFKDTLIHHEVFEDKPAFEKDLNKEIAEPIKKYLKNTGIEKLYSHQYDALESIFKGSHTAVLTPTGSGKSLIYNTAVLNDALKDKKAKALYIFPMKALEQDQLKNLNEFITDIGWGNEINAAIYDGDTKTSDRTKIIRNIPNIVITTPDMLHLGIIPHHAKWEELFRNLKYIVIDELHTYKGVFGTHFLHILRRLKRVFRHYGANPQFICSSATVSNPDEFLTRLTGEEFKIVIEDGAPKAQRNFLFINPVSSSYSAASQLFLRSVRSGYKTIVFSKARKITELIYTWVIEKAPYLTDRVSSYRAGYTPAERREIEAKLFGDEMDGVISTSALEMGIDIGGLDVCILVGYPGTITSAWQRGGRVGRSGQESAIFMIAMQDALDQYFMNNPGDFFGRKYEEVIVDETNRPIQKPHIVCAANEIPLKKKDVSYPFETTSISIRELEFERGLFKSATEDLWYAAQQRPQRNVQIRSIGEGYSIFMRGGKKPIGEVGGSRVFSECHKGAVYLHRGKQYVVEELDLENKNVIVGQSRENYYTHAMSEKETEILSRDRMKPVRNFIVKEGRLKVTEEIVGYQKKEIYGQTILDTHELTLPPQMFETVGIWIEIEWAFQDYIKARDINYMGAIHAIEHALIALFPLFIMCDRDDVGGICYPVHHQVGKSAIFIYDGYPGGIGLAQRCYEKIEEHLEATLKLLEDCDCEFGCPSCIHSPKCGAGNKPLHKEGAVMLLELLLAKRTIDMKEEKNTEDGLKKGLRNMEDFLKNLPPEVKEEKKSVVYFDLETQRSAAEVGGWGNNHLMRVSVGVAFDSKEDRFIEYFEKDMDALIDKLKRADLVVGFNVKRFDYGVLKGYTDFDFSKLNTFDILENVHKHLGFRLSLDHLAKNTLQSEKSADGLQALRWFKEGKLKQIAEYCLKDVEITRDLFLFGEKNKHVIFERKGGGKVQLPVDWNSAELISKKKEPTKV
ncbi:DEAD/DEAH box helicase [Candidatus Auribacterota bacterium]